jgi:GT2 family glycosyltransferase
MLPTCLKGKPSGSELSAIEDVILKLAVSILNYKTPDLTLKATQRSLQALIDVQGDWEILIVDNFSQDDSEDIINRAIADHQQAGDQNWDKVRLLQAGKNGGFGAGNNYAINYARAHFDDLEYVYVLNPDAFPEKEAIVELVRFLDQNDHYAFAGSYIYGDDGTPHETAFRFPSLLGEFEGAIRFGPVSKLLEKHKVPIGMPDQSVDVDWLAGASMLMRVSALEKIGIFDETFFLYFEETDLCLRAAREGWQTRYVKESRVEHIGSASTGMKTWTRIPGFWLDSRKYYFTKNHGAPYFFLTTIFKLFGMAFYSLRCKVQGKENADPNKFASDLFKHAFF